MELLAGTGRRGWALLPTRAARVLAALRLLSGRVAGIERVVDRKVEPDGEAPAGAAPMLPTACVIATGRPASREAGILRVAGREAGRAVIGSDAAIAAFSISSSAVPCPRVGNVTIGDMSPPTAYCPGHALERDPAAAPMMVTMLPPVPRLTMPCVPQPREHHTYRQR